MDSKTVPQLVAHRGYMEKYPENSWVGLKAAIDAGACWLEFDVQMCSDGGFILLHDASFKRTANIEKTVYETTLNGLNSISIHEPERFEHKFSPLPVTTLENVLSNLLHYPKIRVMVEIKDESLKHWGVPQVMGPLLDMLEPHQDNCILISFNYAALEYAHNHSDVNIGWVIEKYDSVHRMQAISLQPEYLICNQDKLPPEQLPWAGPWQWMLYDITAPDIALKWGELGIDLIETRDIGTMLQHVVLHNRACKHEV